jgi:cyclohexyl-isocyanide hydratase
VTAGIDFGLALVREIWGEPTARAIALGIEYRPAPPFSGGHPDAESESITAAVGTLLAERAERRLRASERAAARL